MNKPVGPEPRVRWLMDALKRVGFDGRALDRPAMTAGLWPRPPFHTHLMLADLPVQSFLDVQVLGGLNTVLGAYERFVAQYITSSWVSGIDSQFWALKEIPLDARQARMLFTPGMGQTRRNYQLNVVQLAALASYNGGKLLASDDRNFVVEGDGYRFGIEDGAVITNDTDKRKQTRGLCVKGTTLAAQARVGGGVAKKPSVFEVIRQWLLDQPFDTEALELAVQATWWRSQSRYPMLIKQLTFPSVGEDALRRACLEAAQYRNFDRPLAVLHDIFVPQFLSPGAFSKLFGSPSARPLLPLDDKWITRWDQALEDLSPGYDLTS